MKTKDYKGITLIALIVTIIVLLILAGVSISILTGDNGILTQAVNASTATDVAETKETIELAVIGYLDENGEYTISDVENAVTDSGATLNKDGITVTTAKGNEVDISDLVNGATTLTLAEQVASANYGDTVEYNAGGVDDWKIFYNDGTYVYLITSDYLDTSLIPEDAGFTASSTYFGYWSYSTISSLSNNLDNSQSRFMFSGLSNIFSASSSYQSFQVATLLLDVGIWSNFVDTDYADYAIGTPTIEMWVASWNSKNYTTLYTAVETYGYYLGTSDSPETYSANLSSDDGYNDSLYFPYQGSSIYSDGRVYWLTSPSARQQSYMTQVGCTGLLANSTVTCSDSSDAVGALRPVVSLKADCTGSYSNGTWTLNN